jgi:hypothetical protein
MMNPPKTRTEAEQYYYYGHNGVMVFMNGRCAWELWSDGAIYCRQCSRKSGHGPDKLYCKQHARKVKE